MNTTDKRLRVLHVGCGGISQAWFQAATANPSVELVGLVDLQEEAARRRAAEFNLTGAAIGTDLETLLHRVKPDIVFDCTVPEAHVRVVTTALAHGCHVPCGDAGKIMHYACIRDLLPEPRRQPEQGHRFVLSYSCSWQDWLSGLDKSSRLAFSLSCASLFLYLILSSKES